MFDVAKQLLVVVVEGGVEVSREDQGLDEMDLPRRAGRVAELGVDVLICGAISAPLECMLVSAGVRVVGHVCGPVKEVLEAFVTGQLTDTAFLMPGCCGRQRGARRRHRGGRCRPGTPGGTV